MLGPQIGIVVKNTHDIKYYKLLFKHYQDKLEALMSLYYVENPNFIYYTYKTNLFRGD